MADLQDELHSTTGLGGFGEPLPGPERRAARFPQDAGDLVREEADGTGERDPLGRARALLAAHPVADGHNGLPRVLRNLPWYDLELGESALGTDLPRLRAGHVGAQFWSLHLPEFLDGDRAVGATLEQLDLVRAVVGAHPEGLRLAHDAGQLADARNCGRTAVVPGPAAAAAIDDSLGILRSLHALGLRLLTLARTSWTGGAGEAGGTRGSSEAGDTKAAGGAGLTRFGEEVVREMNRLGVLADLSGASDATARRCLALSKAPVVFTRSAARALRPHPANLPDDLLTEVGTAHGLCLVPLTAEQTGPSLRDVADHLDHVHRLAGAHCVGLSGTYDTGTAHPGGLADTSRYPYLVAELLDRGWTDADVALLTWGNVQRVVRCADFTARAAQQRRGPSAARIEDLDG
ncbi:microsomal dipeptidase-like Zn-dependent dipeptidase [Streptomyces sp. B3I7]|uniref:dipeptidase n=1 Tax=Streptomyces sp. B3I7 TaxID=3042269 RepID=UPI0027841D98|nr:dipeptidase [Streptomyces sp. B3I7]MDQ0813043.1 microsomal dipeptidase-like Zn-dependent dipeptidase [Streptomyces sp. B3I7]